MDTLSFRKLFEQFSPLTDDTWQAFEQELVYKHYARGELLIENGQVEHFVQFINSGMVRVYGNKNGEEYCTNFRFAGELTSSITSFITRKPSNYSIQALEETECLAIAHSAMEVIYKEHTVFNLIGRKIIEQLYVEKHEREMAFLSQTATERYTQLLDQHPEFSHNISVKHLASYLGIHPESLSRIRSSL